MASTEAALGPVAEKTALRWACSGPFPGCVVKSKFNSYVQTSLQISSVSARFYQGYIPDQHENEDCYNLEKLIERQWEVENLGMSEPTPKLTNKMQKTCSKPTPDEWTEKEKLADQPWKLYIWKTRKLIKLVFHGRLESLSSSQTLKLGMQKQIVFSLYQDSKI